MSTTRHSSACRRTASTGIATSLPRSARSSPERRSVARIGLMLYTVRDECARDFEGVIREVGALGFEGVELFDLHGHTPEQVRGWLDEAGLVAVGRHAGIDLLENDLVALAGELSVLGTDRLALSWIEPPTTLADARAWGSRTRSVAQRASELGPPVRLPKHA